jgi:hypothetical protein
MKSYSAIGVIPASLDYPCGPDPSQYGNLWGYLYLNLDHDMVLRNINPHYSARIPAPLHWLSESFHFSPVGVLAPTDFLKVKRLCETRHPGEEMIRAGTRYEELLSGGYCFIHHKHVHDLFPNLTSYQEIVDTPNGRYNSVGGDLRLLEDLGTPGLGYFGMNRDRLQRDRPLVCATYQSSRDDWRLAGLDHEPGDLHMLSKLWQSFKLVQEKPLCVVKHPRKMARLGFQMFRRSDLRSLKEQFLCEPERVTEVDGDSVYSEDEDEDEDEDNEDADSEGEDKEGEGSEDDDNDEDNDEGSEDEDCEDEGSEDDQDCEDDSQGNTCDDGNEPHSPDS